MTKTLLASGIVIAGYGLVQYVNPPAWDGFWVLNSCMFTQGVAEPFGLRIFGPMNSSARILRRTDVLRAGRAFDRHAAFCASSRSCRRCF